MKSISIWYKPLNPELKSVQDVELHFNLWKIPNGTNTQINFLDIGIKLADTTNIDELKLYFPFNVAPSDFVDVVDKFINKPDLLSAIFNENYKVSSTATSKLSQVTDDENKAVFDIYKTSLEDIKRVEKYKGVIFKITIPRQSSFIYFRFRVKGKFVQSLSTVFSPKNAIFESAFSEMQMIDFRVNEARDLDLTLLEEIKRERKLKIKKQHFFFICSNDEEITGFHKPFISCRNLENYRWHAYIDLPNDGKGIFLAYHWKDENTDNSNILIKTKYEKNNWRTIAKFLAITITIELLGHWIWELIKLYI